MTPEERMAAAARALVGGRPSGVPEADLRMLIAMGRSLTGPPIPQQLIDSAEREIEARARNAARNERIAGDMMLAVPGAGIGLMVGGPLGALVGVVVGCVIREAIRAWPQ